MNQIQSENSFKSTKKREEALQRRRRTKIIKIKERYHYK